MGAMTPQDPFPVLLGRVKREFPGFRIKDRKKSFLQPVFWLLEKITRRNYDTFTTTIGSTMYVGPLWYKRSSRSKYRNLRHELMHVRQFYCWPLGRWAAPLNHVLMALCYLLVLPIVLTMRARFEREGYKQTLLVEYELYGQISEERMEGNARWLADTFGGPAYLFMWTKKAAYDWAMRTQRQINQGLISNPEDRVLYSPGEGRRDASSSR